jgi:hypothetical protein
LEAERVDAEEDEKYGKGRRGDELPEELARRESRLRVIREAKEALEREAKERAEEAARGVRAKLEAREQKEKESGRKARGRPPHVLDPALAKPAPKAQKNFTDPESRIMVDGATKGFEQAYNVQAAVDSKASRQVGIAAGVTQETNDKEQLAPMLKGVEENLGEKPEKVSADAGYFSEAAVTDEGLEGIDLYVTPDRQKHGERVEAAEGELADGATVIEAMRHKLKTREGQEVYKRRKGIVEPVFGQIKEVRGLRRFSFRGLEKVRAEWSLICLTHNLLKLFRSAQGRGRIGWKPA